MRSACKLAAIAFGSPAVNKAFLDQPPVGSGRAEVPGKRTNANNRTVAQNSTSNIATIKLDAARGHVEVRIDHSGFSDTTSATMEICAFVSNERMFHSASAIACLKNSRR